MDAERFIPATQLAEHPANCHLDWQLPLPEYAQPRAMAVNVPGVNAIARWGALARITVHSGSVDSDEGYPMVSDPGSEGAATAARSWALSWKRKKFSTVEIDPLRSERGDATSPWRDVRIRLDVGKLGKHLSERGELGEPKAWAAAVNQILWRGIGRAALANTAKDNLLIGTVCTASGIPIVAIADGALRLVFHEYLSQTQSLTASIVCWLAVAADMARRFRNEEAQEYGLDSNSIPHTLLPFGADRLAAISLSCLHNRHLVQYRP